ncbi:MAG TPA: ion channel [Sandaracinaceae bacterium LLY-WYZ-13_1]|nr:ion channel [Sandaracinaceae bacterium LLY-WYZ-13_1]
MSEERRRKPLEAYLLRVGQRKRPFTDAYAFLLRSRWAVVVGIAASVYLSFNVAFALLYLAVPGSVANADGTFLDAFFFSVQTFAAIGYGFMYSQGVWGNAVVVAESFVSLLCIALLTGIVFAKFARPHARVLFSEPILVETRDGVPTLTFRVANERGNDVVEASVRVSALMTYHTKEGAKLRRFHDLSLQRSSTPFFLLSWQVFHPITEDSPLYGMSRQAMVEGDVRFSVALTGLDGTFAQTIHARHIYWAEDVRVGHRFVDVIEDLGDGRSRMDFRLFHRTEPEPASRG